MEWVASSLALYIGTRSIQLLSADLHSSAASSRLNWHPRRFKWTRPFRWKTKSGFCTCAVTFRTCCTKYTGCIKIVLSMQPHYHAECHSRCLMSLMLSHSEGNAINIQFVGGINVSNWGSFDCSLQSVYCMCFYVKLSFSLCEILGYYVSNILILSSAITHSILCLQEI